MTNAERQQRFRVGRPKPRSKTMNEAVKKAEVLREPPRMPLKQEDYMALRALKHERTINDYVEDIHLKLIADQHYNDLLHAIYDEQAVTGLMRVDDVLAAQLIQKYAVDNNVLEVASAKLATVVKAMKVVLRRYRASRKIRRNTVGGVVVESDDDNNDNDE
jgi:hypothetical protein